LKDGGWLTAQALVVVETSKGETFTHDGYTLIDTRDYGETQVTFLASV
jgi:16S rRNA G966 N2-methylase RsmD